MCGCEHHRDQKAPCTCRCPDHTWKRREQEQREQRLVVIDPEDREQVERLWRTWTTLAPDHRLAQDNMQAALREFANPKPDEPTGLGAVVEDAEGRRWVRTYLRYGTGWVSGDEEYGHEPYRAIAAVRVLSEGVPSC